MERGQAGVKQGGRCCVTTQSAAAATEEREVSGKKNQLKSEINPVNLQELEVRKSTMKGKKKQKNDG